MADILITTAIQGIAGVTDALDRVQRSTRDLNKAAADGRSSFDRFSIGINNLQGALVGLGLAAVARQFLDITLALDRTRATLVVATGSVAQASSDFESMRRLGDRLGVSVLAMSNSFSQLTAASKGTRLEGLETSRIFEAVTTAAGRLSLTATDTEGAIRAIGQMMSKGKVQAEELRGQLGDRLPGAFNLMARAIGVTTAELDRMLVRGEVMAEDALPKLARELEKTFGLKQGERIETLQAAVNRMSNSVVSLVDAIAQAGAAERLRLTFEGIATAGELAANAVRLLSGEISAAQFARRAEETGLFSRALNFLKDAALPKSFIEISGAVANLTSRIIIGTSEVDNFAAALENSKQQAERFAIEASKSFEDQRKAVLDTIEATEARKKADRERVDAFVAGQEESIRVIQNQARQRREVAKEAEREAKEAAREAERVARERERNFKEQQRLALDTARFEREQGRVTTEQVIELLQSQLSAAKENTQERLQLQRELAAEFRGLNEQMLSTEFAEAFAAGTAVSLEEGEKLRQKMEELAEQTDTFNKVVADIPQMFQETFDPVNDFRELVGAAFTGLKDTISNFIQTGKLNFKDFFQSLLKSVADFLASAAVKQFLSFIGRVTGLTSGGGGGDGIGAAIKGIGTQIAQSTVGKAVGSALGIGGAAAGTAAGTAAAGTALGGGATAGLGGFTGATITAGGGAAAAGGGAGAAGAAGAAAGGGAGAAGAAGGGGAAAGGTLAAIAPFAAAALPIAAFLARTLGRTPPDAQKIVANLRARGLSDKEILARAQLARAKQLRRIGGLTPEERARNERNSRSRQTGGDLIATSPTNVLVGETGPERLSVVPMGGLGEGRSDDKKMLDLLKNIDNKIRGLLDISRTETSAVIKQVEASLELIDIQRRMLVGMNGEATTKGII